RRERALLWGVLVAAWEAAWGQLRYSVAEEMPKGSFVGDVAKDLGLDLPALRDRGVQLMQEGEGQYFALNMNTGHLFVNERIDREEICGRKSDCVLKLEILLQGQMKIYKVAVQVTDINDNTPAFQLSEFVLKTSETASKGSRYLLPSAQDPDIEQNTVQTYALSDNKHFYLDVQTGPDGSKFTELVLAKALDREEAAFHELVLRASDGGEPARTGTARIRVAVLDANDNAPVFSQAEYTVRVPEDVPVGSRLLTVNATDADDGINSEITYTFRKITSKASQLFNLDPKTGELIIRSNLNYEENESYELEIQAQDGAGLSTRGKILVCIDDTNDNVPEITVSSSVTDIAEGEPAGTVVALLRVRDRDSGENGEVSVSLPEGLPFRLEKSFEDYYRVVTSRELDREEVSEYNVTVRAADGGSPALWSSAVLALRVLDVNDNAPVFAEARYSARLPENNAAGALVLRVRAADADWGQNARVRDISNSARQLFSLDSRTGEVTVRGPLDYEERKYYEATVEAKDGGGLSAHAKVHIDILDLNDNVPTL
ncbi:PCDG2 protein, partial [Aegotheles bennettii]|nr:PCDG2 protein [Aegotheles bennettii]